MNDQESHKIYIELLEHELANIIEDIATQRLKIERSIRTREGLVRNLEYTQRGINNIDQILIDLKTEMEEYQKKHDIMNDLLKSHITTVLE
jgi:septal ring factor EnvC (AmiA/AmiB activator)